MEKFSNRDFSKNYMSQLDVVYSIEKNNFESCLCYFKEYIVQKFSLEKVYELSFSSEIDNRYIRPILWKIFLNIFHPRFNLNEWYNNTKLNRTFYYKLKSDLNKKKNFSNDPLQNVGIIK
jgi:hypothetical protein